MKVQVELESLRKEQFQQLMLTDASIRIGKSSRNKVKQSYLMLEQALSSGKVIYGINTGFGKLANTVIDNEKLATLQKNLVLSHASGVGDYLKPSTARLIFAMKLISLSKGCSGISEGLLDYMTEMFNKGIIPLIPEKGSVGASGDLVPLAHLAMAVIGEGEVLYGNKQVPATQALKNNNLEPYTLGPKEGLALLNGMQVSTAMVFENLLMTECLFKHAIITGSLSVDGACGSDAPFHSSIHQARGHQEQIDCARWYADLLKDSEIRKSHIECDRVQDPYSLRCQPQVMGACLAQIRHVAKHVLTEANGVSDNPLIIPEVQKIISGGNFHGEIIAMAADNLALAIAEIGALAERRIALLIDASISFLPAFLVKESGINSGFMIAHVTAAACASDNKALAHPHSVDSLPTSANQEDHVSMAANAARRLSLMVDNTLTILAVELLAACQALEFRKPFKTSPRLDKVYKAVRKEIPVYDKDRYFASDIEQAKKLILSDQLIRDFGSIYAKSVSRSNGQFVPTCEDELMSACID